jgi:hypothetical protein
MFSPADTSPVADFPTTRLALGDHGNHPSKGDPYAPLGGVVM